MIEPLAGVITVSGLIDREKQENYSIVVRPNFCCSLNGINKDFVLPVGFSVIFFVM